MSIAEFVRILDMPTMDDSDNFVAEPLNKKFKQAEHPIFRTFKKNEKLLKYLLEATECIDKGYSKMNVCFLQLDIADPPKRRCFSKANCHTKDYPPETAINIGSIFYAGVKVLANYTQNRFNECLPEDESSKEALKRLLLFLSEEPPAEVFEAKKYKDDDFSWAVILAEHIFSKLSIGDHYILDKYCPGKHKFRKGKNYFCPCKKKEKISGWFGDTSFGCTRGWHGSVDILINQEVPASVIFREQDEGTSIDDDESSSFLSDSSETSIEVKTTFNTDRNMQLISQCIVFSFLQFKQDPTLNHYLIPLIGVCRSKVKILFYDCENDILLKTSPLNLLDTPNRLSPEVVVLLWLVLNYKLFSTGVPEGYDEHKSEFPVFARDLIHHYREEVKSKISWTREDDEDTQWAARPRNTPKTVLPKNVCVVGVTDSDTDSDV